MKLDRTALNNQTKAFALEWLETNGLGGYASSTVAGANTRRYHGLLVAATHPPVGRVVLLSKFEETLVIGGERFELSCNQYPGAIHPSGFQYLTQFRLDPFPIFTFEVGGIEIEKSVFMQHGGNTTVIEYRVTRWSNHTKPERNCRLELRPLIAFRDFHALTHANSALQPGVGQSGGQLTFQPYPSLPVLHFAHNAGAVEVTGNWYYNFEYAVERERGLDYTEDLFQPFTLFFVLNNGDLSSGATAATVIASLEPHHASDVTSLRAAEIARRKTLLADAPQGGTPEESEWICQLMAAADQFIVSRSGPGESASARGGDKTVIAGYHWFADWGRDTMIALPGLTLATGRYDVAKNILSAFARHVSQGMLPNRFPDAGQEPEYNSVDAALWFFLAVQQYLDHTSDDVFVRTELFPALAEILDWHISGTRYGIRLDDDGLLRAGEPGVQLTWMDAKISDWVVTPRHGKPVEIQALWYNALRIMEGLAKLYRKPSLKQLCASTADRALASFNEKFWNESAGCLFDVISGVDGADKDPSIRPNQIFALSLRHTMLSHDRARLALEVVERELLTPFGLRTLSPSDPQYRPVYGGDIRSRDSAYHQGTVWPWLLGPFLSAYIAVNGANADTFQRALVILRPLLENLKTAGLGQISEVFNGDPPHAPGGCIAQAWSASEALRITLQLLEKNALCAISS